MDCNSGLIQEVREVTRSWKTAQTGSEDTDPVDDQEHEIEIDDESVISFSPIDSSYSYSVSHLPPSLEVIPMRDLNKFQNSENDKVVRTNMRKYGSPPGDSINTRHVSGKKIGKKHEQFALSAGMMLGVRECVGGVSGASEFEGEKGKCSLDEECNKVLKYEFPPGTSFVTSNIALPYRYKCKAYAPLVFSKIRSAAGVEKQRFLHSICGNNSFIEFISNAKSGQFFFYSHDGRYMIKTVKSEEKNFLHQILPKYYHYTKDNPHSFVTHFYGMYRVKIPELGKCTHFVIMKSVFNTLKEIHKIYDLKGSTLGRTAKRGDSVRKDLDILEEERKLYVGAQVKNAVMEQIRKDAHFLADLQIMDYSLLLGVHLCTNSHNNMSIRNLNLEQTGEEKALREELIEKLNRKGRADLLRTNTPLRRQQMQEVVLEGGDLSEEGIHQFLRDAEDCATCATTLGAVREEDGSVTSDDSSYMDKFDLEGIDDTDTLISDTALSDIALSDSAVSITALSDSALSDSAISTLASSSSNANFISTNPYSAREDGGIECIRRDGNKILSREIYFGGIIDILQCYNARKWGETIMRRAAGSSESDISCVNPIAYAARFIEFIDKLLV